MDQYQLERIYQLEQRKKAMIKEIAEEIAPVISEQIQETIAWQTDGLDYADNFDGDEYIEFAWEIRKEILKQLNDGM